MPRVNFSELVGETIKHLNGWEKGSDSVEFICASGRKFRLFHDQSCCENVQLEDVVGDLSDLFGATILMADEVSSAEHPEGYKPEYEPESYTWTFYKLATAKGYVTLRWLGTSNGYYSESVEFEESK